jgi:fido (protein-threonine AMPylation protein)
MRRTILDGLRRALLDRTPLSALPAPAWEALCVEATWASNAIEGNALGLPEVRALISEGRTPGGRPVGDILETVQHFRTLSALPARVGRPVGADTALDLHGAVFRGVLPDAGTWRRGDVRVLGSPHVPPAAEHVRGQLMEWELEYRERRLTGEDPLALGAWMHHAFEAVHPFSDGNGRVGRLLLALHLLSSSWPPVSVLPGDAPAYHAALDSGHVGDLRPLVALLEVLAARSLLTLLGAVGADDDALSRVSDLASRGPYGAKYLALRASQGALPAVKRGGRWWTSPRTLALYGEAAGRG